MDYVVKSRRLDVNLKYQHQDVRFYFLRMDHYVFARGSERDSLTNLVAMKISVIHVLQQCSL